LYPANSPTFRRTAGLRFGRPMSLGRDPLDLWRPTIGSFSKVRLRGDAQVGRGRTRPEGECFPGQRHRRRRPGEREDRRVRGLGPDAGSRRGFMRSARRRPNHKISLRPTHRASCRVQCGLQAVSEPDPSNPREQPHGSRRSCLFQQRPRQARALARTRRGGALARHRC
jgi:hypothetical protein